MKLKKAFQTSVMIFVAVLISGCNRPPAHSARPTINILQATHKTVYHLALQETSNGITVKRVQIRELENDLPTLSSAEEIAAAMNVFAKNQPAHSINQLCMPNSWYDTGRADAIENKLVQKGIQVSGSHGERNGILESLRYNSVGQHQSELAIDMGWDSSRCFVLSTAHQISHPLSLARGDMVKRVSKVFKVSDEEASDLLDQKGFVKLGPEYDAVEDPVADKVSEVVREVVLQLADEIQELLAKLEQEKGIVRPKKLFLLGSNSTMAFTEHALQKKLDMEPVFFNAFDRLYLENDIDRDELSAVAHELPAAIGFAVKQLTK